MGTVIRSKISTRSKWYIPKELFLELKHFCRQYRSWFKRLKEIEEPTLKTNWLVEIDLKKPHNRVMPTTEDDKRLYLNKIKAVDEALSHVEKSPAALYPRSGGRWEIVSIFKRSGGYSLRKR